MTDRRIREPADLDQLSFWENGLVPVVVQDASSRNVLMVAFANRTALERTFETGQMHYWSRSRKELWHKGATSGNYQELVSLHADCDADTLLALVRQKGPACHTGEKTCFGDLKAEPIEVPQGGERRETTPESSRSERILPDLWDVLCQRAVTRPSGSYTARLLADENLRLKKLGEENAELILAFGRHDQNRIAEEAADLLYHLLVALLGSGVTLNELLTELEKRKA
jgi:phosphoribosyl-ATP pyrophosphohydrolase/phosphoribosyl-AMP cyclohydrolase